MPERCIPLCQVRNPLSLYSLPSQAYSSYLSILYHFWRSATSSSGTVVSFHPLSNLTHAPFRSIHYALSITCFQHS